MQRQLFYTSPVDHRHLEDWGSLARTLKDSVQTECRGVSLKVGTEPVFGYGTDTEEAIGEIEERHLAPREVHVDLWCSIVHYGAFSLTLGSGIRRAERRGLMRRLKKRFPRETLLHECEGTYELDSGRAYGYALTAGDEEDRVTLSRLMEPLNEPIYFAEHWLLSGAGERLDEESFKLIDRVGPNLSIFLVRNEEAAARVWAACESGEGLIAVYGEDPAEKEILRRFSSFEDLSILVGEAPSAGLRVTMGRCRPEEHLVVLYGPPWAPEIDEPIVFMI